MGRWGAGVRMEGRMGGWDGMGMWLEEVDG